MSAPQAISLESAIQQLCQVIIADQGIQNARNDAEAFLADDASVSLYRNVMNTGSDLERRHRSGEALADEEIRAFEDLQAQVEGNTLIQAFQAAQRSLQDVANQVNLYVTKTLEKGAVPTAEEIAESSGGGCCGGGGGGGCGCN